MMDGAGAAPLSPSAGDEVSVLRAENDVLCQRLRMCMEEALAQRERACAELAVVSEMLGDAEAEAEHWRARFESLASERRGATPGGDSGSRGGPLLGEQLERVVGELEQLERKLGAAGEVRGGRPSNGVGGHGGDGEEAVGEAVRVARLACFDALRMLQRCSSVFAQDGALCDVGGSVRILDPVTRAGAGAGEEPALIAALKEDAVAVHRALEVRVVAIFQSAVDRALAAQCWHRLRRFALLQRHQRGLRSQLRGFLASEMERRVVQEHRFKAFMRWRSVEQTRRWFREMGEAVVAASALAATVGANVRDHAVAAEALAGDVDELLQAQVRMWRLMRRRSPLPASAVGVDDGGYRHD